MKLDVKRETKVTGDKPTPVKRAERFEQVNAQREMTVFRSGLGRRAAMIAMTKKKPSSTQTSGSTPLKGGLAGGLVGGTSTGAATRAYSSLSIDLQKWMA